MSERKSTRVHRVCERCGKDFTVGKAQVARRPSRYCSRACLQTPLAERFRKYIAPPNENGCHLWTGTALPHGYGTIGIGRKEEGKIYAHRLSYQLAFGPIPAGMDVCHNCPGDDNPRCVNPAHLFLGTPKDNTHDAMKKGRFARGEKRPNAKLADKQVIEIRTRYAARGITQAKLAEEFNVCEGVIQQIINRQKWTHLP